MYKIITISSQHLTIFSVFVATINVIMLEFHESKKDFAIVVQSANYFFCKLSELIFAEISRNPKIPRIAARNSEKKPVFCSKVR